MQQEQGQAPASTTSLSNYTFQINYQCQSSGNLFIIYMEKNAFFHP
jgi:hypothetical protein